VATILLTEQPDARYVRPHTVCTRDRLQVRLWPWRLDRALARGALPDSSAALSLHAHRLIGRNVRRALARELRELPGSAAHPRSRLDPTVPICRKGVLQAVELIEELAQRLEGPEPVDARGVAQVRNLLRSAESPLFDLNGVEEFGRALQAALDALAGWVSV
jgi:hypothetical protein